MKLSKFTHAVTNGKVSCFLWFSNRGTRDQIANIRWIMEKAREPEKHLFLFIDYAKAFDCVDHNKLWKILKER